MPMSSFNNIVGLDHQLVLVAAASVLLLCLVIDLQTQGVAAAAAAEAARDAEKLAAYHHVVKVSSLLPQESCRLSTSTLDQGHEQGPSLQVLHRYGPCSKDNRDQTGSPTPSELLEMDEARVKYFIQSRVNIQPQAGEVVEINAATLPAKSGSSIGTGNYVVSIALGTPARRLTIIFDTGSDFSWTQCKPCTGACYRQVDSIFDPSASITYANISCHSAACANILSGTSIPPVCAGSTCVYGIQYGDTSFSLGFFAADTLTLSSGNVFPNFRFGCGENNQGLFKGSSGLLGLGRNPISLVSQTATKYGKYFSYCLPTKSGFGSLTFGNTGKGASSVTFTQLLANSRYPSFYFLSLHAISVGSITLPIPPSVFSTPGTIIDSGTVVTRLPPTAYTALRTAFRQLMSNYPLTTSLSILDTCYDFSSYTTILVPKITLSFSDGAQLKLGITGIFYVHGISQVCLAFAGNKDSTTIGILGNIQQQTLNVIYDVAGGKLGFAPGGCS